MKRAKCPAGLIALLAKSLERRMSDSHELYDQAEKLKDEGNLEAAIAKLNELLAQDGAFVLAHSAMAVLLGKVGRHPEAVDHARKVCELEPNEPFSFTQLSVICQRAGLIPQAEDAMARARMLQQGH
jgi:Flp pilus assembly protein TadD